jgi:hypothetical protein
LTTKIFELKDFFIVSDVPPVLGYQMINPGDVWAAMFVLACLSLAGLVLLPG